MRFIGNKDLLIPEIHNLLNSKNLLNKNYKFFDAFCGTGSVSDSLKDHFQIISNDLLKWCTLYTKGRLNAQSCNFNKLGYDPFEFLNSNNERIEGFFYQNYSPAASDRMYFTPNNAGRIDYFRITIENWLNESKINEVEYSFLLACLIESISFVSNTAGVYGAFLKHWDPRSKKDIVFKKIDYAHTSNLSSKIINSKIEDIISEIDCDILYIDPPYTQNQYGTQYHLLETLVLYDNPEISRITGSRSTAPMRSDWSKNFKSHILFDKIISETKAKYIIFSYSQDGFMSKSFIESSLKRYGKKETYLCKNISYKKYKNSKSRSQKDHFEYLFYIEKKEFSEIKYESPLNYIGNKSKHILELELYMPTQYECFIDSFGGGFNVGINQDCKTIIYNDLNYLVEELVESFKTNDTYQYILYIKRMIKKFNLEKGEEKGYLKIRNYYNSLLKEKRDPRLLYTIILYGYNQQIRFNSDHNFNNPVGMRWFNDKVLEKMISFSRIIKKKNIIFENKNYLNLADKFDKNSFIYLDPPYMMTTGSYNDGKRGFNGWNQEEENKMFNFLNQINKSKGRFMLSYVLEHKGKFNSNLKNWIKDNDYKMIELNLVPGVTRKEIIVINYGEEYSTLRDCE